LKGLNCSEIKELDEEIRHEPYENKNRFKKVGNLVLDKTRTKKHSGIVLLIDKLRKDKLFTVMEELLPGTYQNLGR